MVFKIKQVSYMLGFGAGVIATATLSAICVFKAYAAPIVLHGVPASAAVASIDNASGASVYLDKRINAASTVSLNVPDAADPGFLLQAVRSLSASLDADYRKGFVIASAPAGVLVSAPIMDAPGKPVSFPNETISIDQALKLISVVEGANIQISAPMPDTITFTAPRLTLRQAVREIAVRTHTVWNPSYLLTPHLDRDSKPGKVWSYNVAGRPVLTEPVDSDTAPVLTPDLPLNPGTSQDPTYQSAITRGDASAMMKFQDDAGGN